MIIHADCIVSDVRQRKGLNLHQQHAPIVIKCGLVVPPRPVSEYLGPASSQGSRD